jgi:arabinose-5-phosphate isomerase
MKEIKDMMRDILAAESKAIEAIPVTNQYEKAIDLIIERVHKMGGKLIASGMGKAGQIAMNIATTFCSTGTPAVFLHPSEAQHGDLGIMQPNDVMLLLSNSGKTREILELTALAKNLNPTAPIIVITGNGDSELAKIADALLCTGGAPEVCPFGLTPTISTTCMTVMGDVLVVGTMQRIDFTVEDYAKRHHGGYLGSTAKRISSNGNINNDKQ